MKRRALFAATHLALVAAFILIITWSHPAWSQSVSIDLGQGGQAGTTSRLIQIAALMGVLSLAPSLLVMVTAFTRIVIVLSLLRSGIGAQGTPPNTVIIGLALFLTFFVMQPTFEQAWTNGLLPMEAWCRASIPEARTAKKAMSAGPRRTRVRADIERRAWQVQVHRSAA
jgi:flagellar biosynthetic protein FliP